MKKYIFFINCCLVIFLLFLDFSCQCQQEPVQPVSNDTSNSYFVIGSNDHVSLHGDVAGYTTISNLVNYRYYVLTNGDYSLEIDNTDAITSSNFIGTSVVTNHYFTNVLITNNNGYHLVTNDAFVYFYRGLISDNTDVGYGTFYLNLTNDDLTLWPNDNVSNGNLSTNHTLTVGSYNLNFSNTNIVFYESGNINNGYLSTNHTLTVGSYNLNFSNANIVFYESGNINNGNLSTNHTLTVGSYNLNFSNANIVFYESGNINNGYLSTNHTLTVGSYNLNFSNANITFHESGNINTGKLGSNHTLTIDGTDFGILQAEASFYPNGSIRNGWLVNDMTLMIGTHSVDLKGSQIIFFYESGKVKQAVLNGAQIFSGTTHQGYIRFNEDGTIAGSGAADYSF